MFKSTLLARELHLAEDGVLVDAQDLAHDDAEGFLCHKLNFCGCGMPEEALAYVRTALRAFETYWASVRSTTPQATEFAAFDLFRATWANDGERYFVWYYLDHLDLTEHGGSVPGWLTPKGAEYLAALDEVLTATPQ